MEQNGVLVGIAPVCGHRQTSPTATYGRSPAGTSTGPWTKPRCEPNAVVTILDVFVGNLPFVSTVGFTCWNPITTKVTNSFADAGSPKVSHKPLVCPTGQIAVGIFGRAGTAIDQVGLICDKWVAAPPSLPPLPPGLTQGQQDIFTVQDTYRIGCGVPPMTWDPALAAAASNWIQSCPKAKDAQGNEYACHENDTNKACPNGGNFPSRYGENLYFGPPSTNPPLTSGDLAALHWICEFKNYKGKFVGGNFTSTQSDPCPSVNGHFTQVVWTATIPPTPATPGGGSRMCLPSMHDWRSNRRPVELQIQSAGQYQRGSGERWRRSI